MPRFAPTPVRAGAGPMHIAVAVPAGWSTACGRTLRRGRVVAAGRVAGTAMCPDCCEIGQHARTVRELAVIAGW